MFNFNKKESMTNPLIGTFTVAVSANTPEHVFHITLSDWTLDQLSRKRILGISFRKEKYEFLNDLADVLKAEILQHLEEITEQK